MCVRTCVRARAHVSEQCCSGRTVDVLRSSEEQIVQSKPLPSPPICHTQTHTHTHSLPPTHLLGKKHMHTHTATPLQIWSQQLLNNDWYAHCCQTVCEPELTVRRYLGAEACWEAAACGRSGLTQEGWSVSTVNICNHITATKELNLDSSVLFGMCTHTVHDLV